MLDGKVVDCQSANRVVERRHIRSVARVGAERGGVDELDIIGRGVGLVVHLLQDGPRWCRDGSDLVGWARVYVLDGKGLFVVLYQVSTSIRQRIAVGVDQLVQDGELVSLSKWC